MTVHDDIVKAIFPIAFLFTLSKSVFVIPLAGNVETPSSFIEPPLHLIQTYFSAEGLLKVTSNAQRLLRLLDLYSQRHLHRHFITSQMCHNLRDVNLLSWLLDPDGTHTLFAVCTPQEGRVEKVEREQKGSECVLETLYHSLHPQSSSDLSIADLWSQEIPEKVIRRLLDETCSLHAGILRLSHL